MDEKCNLELVKIGWKRRKGEREKGRMGEREKRKKGKREKGKNGNSFFHTFSSFIKYHDRILKT
jgi:hypothetical protein